MKSAKSPIATANRWRRIALVSARYAAGETHVSGASTDTPGNIDSVAATLEPAPVGRKRPGVPSQAPS